MFYFLATITVLIRSAQLVLVATSVSDSDETFIIDINYVCQCFIFTIGFCQSITMHEINRKIKNT